MSRSKYNNRKIVIDGHKFDSMAEGEYYLEIMALLKDGVYSAVELQPKVYMTGARILYKPDFKCTNSDGAIEYYDVKGMRTAVFQIKKRLWEYYGPGLLGIIEKKGKKFVCTEMVEGVL